MADILINLFDNTSALKENSDLTSSACIGERTRN